MDKIIILTAMFNFRFMIEALNRNQGAINILLIFALVVVTAYYAKQVKNQTNLMLENEKRRMILDEVQYLLHPKIESLKSEIKRLKDRDLYWKRVHDKGKFETIFKFFKDYDPRESLVHRDFFEEYPDWEIKLYEHDRFYDKLNELYEEAEVEIRTQELSQRLIGMVSRFNEPRHDSYRLKGDHVTKPEILFGNYIINKYVVPERPEVIAPNNDFWKEHKDELLKVWETPKLKSLDEEIEKVLREFEKFDKDLLEELETILEKYRKKYNITETEIWGPGGVQAWSLPGL